MPLSLDIPVSEQFRITPIQKEALKKLGIRTIEDLLYHFPARYGDTAEARSIDSLAKGDTAVIYGKITGLKASKGFHSRITMASASVEDESGRIQCVWFNQPYIAKMTPEGALVRIGGKAGEAFRDEAINEATQVKNKNKTGEPTAPKGGGDDGEAAKKAEELRKDAQELLKQTLESNMSELQLQGVHFQNLLSQLKQFNDQKALSDSEYKAGVLAANEAFNNDIIQQVLDASEKEQAALLEKQTAEDEYRTNRINSIQQVIEESRRAGLTELELLDEQHQQKMDKLAELQEGEVIFKDELKQAELQAELAHSAKKLDIMMGTGSKIQELNKAFQKGQLQGSLAFFAADFGGMSQHSRKMFELTKAARLADAVINIPSTVMAAVKHGTEMGGWPVGAAMGAAALASQLAQLRAIQSATFAGGGSAGGGSAGGGGASASSVAQSQQPQQPLQQRFVNLNLYGGDNTMYSKDSVRTLIQRIGEEVKDGAVLRVS
jgi:hypothetical protein